MQRSANDQQCHPRELQEKEEEPVYSFGLTTRKHLTVYHIPGYLHASECTR